MRRRSLLLGLCGLPLLAAAVEGDPVPSVMWDYHHKRLLGGEPFVFDERVKLGVPPFAEDARQVPVEVDARQLPGRFERLVLWAELNPIPHVLTLYPGKDLEALLAVRIRIEQATAIRAALRGEDGVWHVGSAWIDAAGGGCTAPSVVRAQAGWEQRLGQVHGGAFSRGPNTRLRLQVDHPMDNGLVGGIPEFYLDHAELRTPEGEVLARLDLFPAVSENPSFSFELRGHPHAKLFLHDNNGNEFEAAL
ncbi:quinoprotein dehydrogenase-associated SoxYZ-like carrier [Pseudomonas citronellolis]|uniref:Quinoprotein dehydrogenase-associated SoxYZ-like carrier n=1 Tax=Pseudomonas citronellolis TaxID=53408 RepID=A0AAW6P1L5_9PSED|nr:quinoprotein dehydrogenase-associated SoxYZ-like carrier [Pseudomonas citronellolis]MDF3840769.1 quinoprotein dehydrogenase-associated SoxYZ-like carrier [Pseudomonas citronellolis]WBG61372.1 quinoprotein dehydrogenase-associated SoxYZ-like carrier [Pseudomonas citronellolis]